MTGFLITLGVGVLIGWAIPQPDWFYNFEKSLVNKIVSWASGKPAA